MVRSSEPATGRADRRSSVFDDPPRKEVLLLSCMDLRLLDNIVDFMKQLNLENRYDHLVFAGAAMGARRLESPLGSPKAQPWKHVFFDHLSAAINLLHREIKDIFLLEHLDCGAFKKLHPDEDQVRKPYTQISETGHLADLVHFHREEAVAFAKEVSIFCEKQAKASKKPGPKPWENIRVHCLLMNLIGEVVDL